MLDAKRWRFWYDYPDIRREKMAADIGGQNTTEYELELSPDGRLFFNRSPESEGNGGAAAVALYQAFARDSGIGLLQLGFLATNAAMPSSVFFWKSYADRFLDTVRLTDGLEELRQNLRVAFPEEFADEFVQSAPPLPGIEYLRAGVLYEFWRAMNQALCHELREWSGSVKDYFVSRNPAWHQVDRLCFNLAENPKNPQLPFAFLATYTSGLSESGRLRHLPLKNALEEYSGTRNSRKLVELLQPLHLACEKSEFLQKMLQSKRVFHPCGWSPNDAIGFLRDVPVFEEAGILCRVPDWWKNRSRNRVSVVAKVGEKSSGQFGLGSLLDFSVGLSVGDQQISEEEWRQISEKGEGLALVRGCWVELDREKLDQVLQYWQKARKAASAGGLSFIEAMRLLAGAPARLSEQLDADVITWSRVVPGEALRQTLHRLRQPESIAALLPDPVDLHATLRPYQQNGVKWLGLMHQLGLGPCLADDMGLGKTLQVLAFMLTLKNSAQAASGDRPHLLVVPASLLGNWEDEIRRFTPSLRYRIEHPSAAAGTGSTVDLVITTYGYLTRQSRLQKQAWGIVILDEAQAIKNPGTRQTRVVKALDCRSRLVLTGTPVENRPGDLWSIFDFLNPGLLGSAKEFNCFCKNLGERQGAGYAPLRNLVRPYILRRLKTDRNVIADLPEKTEVRSLCRLSKTQAVFYQQAVEALAKELQSVDAGIQRKGLVFAYLMRLKQICNHPSQWLRDNAFAAADSGKFLRLAEICEEIASRNEKTLIFTQFREMTEPLAAYCQEIFRRPGLVLHGQTPVKARKELVRRFQEDPACPYFVISLKAGGTGLNLTAASHVIHFDRWWNPAVENQATDRAFRIGQKKNVLVHKFVCTGTLEEKIDSMITQKVGIADEILSESAEALLTTEMSDRELLQFVSLDLARTAVED